MLRKIAKLVAYKKAPVKTFVTLHPVKAAKMGLSYWVVKKALS